MKRYAHVLESSRSYLCRYVVSGAGSEQSCSVRELQRGVDRQLDKCWTLDTDYSNLPNGITGKVASPPPSGCSGFTVLNYTVKGSLAKTTGSGGASGTTTFTVNATNPDHTSSGSCQISTKTIYSGQIYNGAAGCNYGNGTWSNSFNQNGSFTWSKNCQTPNGSPTETTYTHQWSPDPTEYLWKMQIGATSDFGGRTVSEAQNGVGTDACWFSGSIYPKYGLTGGNWYVGYLGYNTYGYDQVGWSSTGVTYYRNANRVPCSATVSQNMLIQCTGPSQLYKSNTISAGMTATTVSSTRDGQTQTKTWP